MINRKDSCVGITLFKFGRRKLEFWWVPTDYDCAVHTHEESSGEFFVLFGKHRYIFRNVGERQDGYDITHRPYFKSYTVRASVPHGFTVGSTPMLFLVLTTWKENTKVTSPAIDFHPVTN